MKKNFTLLFLIASFYCVKASHVSGADITYQYLGKGNYKIIVSTYRDCNGIQVSPGNAVIRSGTTSFNQ